MKPCESHFICCIPKSNGVPAPANGLSLLGISDGIMSAQCSNRICMECGAAHTTRTHTPTWINEFLHVCVWSNVFEYFAFLSNTKRIFPNFCRNVFGLLYMPT